MCCNHRDFCDDEIFEIRRDFDRFDRCDRCDDFDDCRCCRRRRCGICEIFGFRRRNRCCR